MMDDEDHIEDSDLDEENERPQKKKQDQQQRPSRAAAPSKNLRAASSSDEEEEVEIGEESSEEEQLSDSSSEEEEEDEEMAEQEDNSDSDASNANPAAAKKKANAGRSLCQRAPAPAPAPNGGRRSARATAAAAKTYNEDAIMQQYYSEEEEEDEEIVEVKPSNRRAVTKKPSFDSNEENKEPFDSYRVNRPQRAAAAVKKKASGYGTSDGEFFEDDSDEEESEKEKNSEEDEDDDGAIYVSSGSDGEYGGGAGGDGDEEDQMYGEDDYDDQLLVNSVERILALRKVQGSPNETELYVKITGWSFRRARWIPRSVLIAAGRAQLVRNFEKKAVNGSIDPYGDLVNGVHPSWLEVDRILAAQETSRLGQLYLVKWRGLGHSEATWERASALEDSEADKAAAARYHKLAEAAAKRLEDEDTPQQLRELNTKDVPDFLNGRSLRPYQLESLEWMAKHWCTGSNCILGDEMGLGKTAQSIAVLQYQRQFGGNSGPHLVIAPLTTLGHWQREIETWTDMDCVVYAGSAADRAACQKYDLFVPGSGGGRGRRGRLVKPNVVLTSYETVLRDASFFTSISWESVIIDEAHRMKTVGSSTRGAIADLDIGWLLLLTGTPVQNNMRELYGLLNLLDNVTYASEADFLNRFGDERTGMSPQQVRELQKALKPILLRRMKEDVETLPEKEECIIWTQLTLEQRAYYKAIFEKQIGTLLAGVSNKNVPNLRNLAMELRKVCCHPFLCDGLEDDIAARRRAAGLETDEISNLVQASGKMLLLHKLLPKLRSEGHKVLIFSQFKIMLDVLEDYMKAANFPVERIDGSTSSRDRQAAIDRYSKEGSDGFVFLLSTRAGGQGITLTAADTCIIYDSDWNPQNDLQAMARCHRIGQEKDVTIYRLVSKDTYEEHVFKTSSRKYGLDEAILGGIAGGGASGSGAGGNGDELDGKKIAELLKHGAHCLDKVEEADAETEAFASEDIDEILKGRTEKRQIGGRAGNTFSIATFEVGDGGAGATGANAGGGGNAHGDDKAFWATLLPEAAAAHEEEKVAAKHGHIMLAPRQRKKVSYNDGSLRRKRRGTIDDEGDSDFNVNEEGNDSDAAGSGQVKKSGPAVKKHNAGGSSNDPKPWSIRDANNYFDQLMRFGFSETVGIPKAVAGAGLLNKGYCQEDFLAVAAALHAMLMAAPTVVPAKPERVPSHQQEAHRQFKLLLEKRQADLAVAPPDEKTAAYLGLADRMVAMQRQADDQAIVEIARIKHDISQWETVINTAAKTLATTHAAQLIPAHCMRAVQDVKLAERIIKFHDAFIPHLKEVELIANWAQSGSQAPSFPHKQGVFPHFWTRAEDTKLLQGLFTLGWAPLRKQAESVDEVLHHKNFGFTTKMVLVQSTASGSDAAAGASGSGAGNTNTSAAAPINPAGVMAKEDSFQVRPSPAQQPVADKDNDDDDFKAKPAAAAGATNAEVVEAPPARLDFAKLNALPRRFTQQEWTKLRDTLTRHVKQLMKYMKRMEEHSLQLAQNQNPAGTTTAVRGFMPYNTTASVTDNNGAGPSRPVSEAPSESSLLPTEVYLGSTSSGGGGSILSDAGAVGGAAVGATSAPQGTKASGSGLLLKKVLQREAIKQLDATAAAGAAGKGEAMEEDPIEPFSDDDDEADKQGKTKANTASGKDKDNKALEPQKKKMKKSPSPAAGGPITANPTPLNDAGKGGAVATPGSATISAVNVFKETRGEFTDGASGSRAKPAGKKADHKKVKSKVMGNQRSLFDCSKFGQYYSRGNEVPAAAAAAAAATDGGGAGAEVEVIDLANSD
jgi:superfamily II DNA or RNA helicase